MFASVKCLPSILVGSNVGVAWIDFGISCILQRPFSQVLIQNKVLLLGQELLDDPAIISAIDEETEFNALVVCVMGLCMHHKQFPYFELSYNCLLLSLCFAVSAGGRSCSSWISARGKIISSSRVNFKNLKLITIVYVILLCLTALLFFPPCI